MVLIMVSAFCKLSTDNVIVATNRLFETNQIATYSLVGMKK